MEWGTRKAPHFMKFILGDCLEKLKDIPDNSIDSIVTDPPYGLSFMGKKWDYDVPSIEVWQECLRVLKPGGYLLSFAGTRTQHRMAVRIEDVGFEIRDMIAWVYGSGFPKSLNIGKAVDKLQGKEPIVVGKRTDGRYGSKFQDGNNQFVNADNNQRKEVDSKIGLITKPATPEGEQWEGWGTALKPALEPITVARKPIQGNVASNCLKWGVGGINIDGCRVGIDGQDDRHAGQRTKTFAKDGDAISGGEGSPDYIPNTQGRFPANLIHDGSDEVVRLFPQSKGASSQNNNSNGHIYRGQSLQESETSLEGHRDWYNDNGSAARFFYCAKASKSERNRGCEGLEEKYTTEQNKWTENDYRKGNGEKTKSPVKNNHPTVKPIALMEYLVKLVSKEGHTVLDPFMGSGSTGIACKKLGREFIGIEKESDYCKIAEARIGAVQTVQEELL